MIDEPFTPQTDWGSADFLGNSLGPPGDHDQAAELAAQDEIDGWLPLEVAAARLGGTISPRGLQHLAELGLADVRSDRSGRPRISLEEAQRIRSQSRAAQRGEL